MPLLDSQKRKEYQKAYYDKNREALLDKQKARYEKNDAYREKTKANSKAQYYRLKNGTAKCSNVPTIQKMEELES